MKKIVLLVGILLPLFVSQSFGFTRLDDTDNKVVRGGYWGLTIFEIYIDSDGSIPAVSNPEAVIQTSFDEWSTVETSYIEFSMKGKATRDEAEKVGSAIPFFIYLDTDGSITEDETGIQDGQGILGMAFPYTEDNSGTGEYVDSTIVLNGATISNDEEMRTTLTHELGHFFGLDHASIFVDGLYVPILYSWQDDSQDKLTQDDIAGLSTIYPSSKFTENYGAIQGTVNFADGAPAFGADIVAFSAETLLPIVSATVGFPNCFGDDFVQSPAGFLLTGLPEGQYYLKTQSYPVFGGLSGGGVFLIEDEGIAESGSGVGAGDFVNFVTGFPTRYYPNKTNMSTGTLVSIKKGKVTQDVAISVPFTNNPSAVFTLYHENPTDLEVIIVIGANTNDFDFSKTIAVSDEDGDHIISQEVDLKDAKSLLPPSSSKKVFLLTRDGESNNLNGALLNFSVYLDKKLYVSKVTSGNSFIGFTNKNIYNSNSIDGSKTISTEKFSSNISFDAICVSEKGVVDKDGIFTPESSTVTTDSDSSSSDDSSDSDGGGCLLNAGNANTLFSLFVLLIALVSLRFSFRRQ